ncbi:hypothetical protein LJ655_25690 [Paraburkholderia sp. MMS20-SJTN17]|uniref:Uncharacterized protein n=1 Tax=Paraburkholderia translucens TaxID=2886945 RepID=A0ABS8KKH6_9BURK|nr:hypothetical protein [Paraburkholderia sp. MMS20-SJTN17]MCC8405227.1 hypothetical protein [Paraburkholderia sp. MMS20-SJTN17]
MSRGPKAGYIRVLSPVVPPHVDIRGKLNTGASAQAQRKREHVRGCVECQRRTGGQIADPYRLAAWLEGAKVYDGARCSKCGSTRRRVRDGSCYGCHLKDSPLDPSQRVRVPQHSRDGWLARLDEKRKEAAGEVWAFEVGDWRARVYPTGRLAVDCDRLHIHSEDWAKVPPARVFEIGTSEPDLVEVMRRAGWSV